MIVIGSEQQYVCLCWETAKALGSILWQNLSEDIFDTCRRRRRRLISRWRGTKTKSETVFLMQTKVR